jgi:restriction endonuclease S subunit
MQTSIINYRDLERTIRFDGEYYQPEFIDLMMVLKGTSCKPLTHFCHISDGNHMSISEHFTDTPGVPYYRGQDITDFFLESAVPIYITEDAYIQDWMKRSYFKPNDILLSIVGTIGSVAMMTENISRATGSCKIAILRPKSIDQGYLSAFLLSKYGQGQIRRNIRGAVQQGLILEDMDQILIYEASNSFQDTVRTLVYGALQANRCSGHLYTQAETCLLSGLDLHEWRSPQHLGYEASFAETQTTERLDAEYFHPEKRQVLQQLEAMSGKRVGDHFKSVRNLFKPPLKDTGERVLNYDLPNAKRYFLDADIEPVRACEVGSTKKRFRRGDVVVSRLRSYLKEIAIVETPNTQPCIGSSEFFVFRSRTKQVNAELLLVYLRSEPVQRILKWCQDGSNHPRFQENEILDLKLPDSLLSIQADITRLLHEGIVSHRTAHRLLALAKTAVEHAVEEGEATATAWLHVEMGKLDFKLENT